MDQATTALTIMTVLIGIIFLGLLIWGIRSGQFHNVEEAKFQIFRKQKHQEAGSTSIKEDKKGGEIGSNAKSQH